MIKPDNYDKFRTMMNWKVYNKEIKGISRFSIGNFLFIFPRPIETEEMLEKFIDIFNKNDFLTPKTFVEFLYDNQIDFDLDFLYCNKNTLKDNKHNLKIILKINEVTKKDWIYYKTYWQLYKNYYLKGDFLNEKKIIKE